MGAVSLSYQNLLPPVLLCLSRCSGPLGGKHSVSNFPAFQPQTGSNILFRNPPQISGFFTLAGVPSSTSRAASLSFPGSEWRSGSLSASFGIPPPKHHTGSAVPPVPVLFPPVGFCMPLPHPVAQIHSGSQLP